MNPKDNVVVYSAGTTPRGLLDAIVFLLDALSRPAVNQVTGQSAKQLLDVLIQVLLGLPLDTFIPPITHRARLDLLQILESNALPLTWPGSKQLFCTDLIPPLRSVDGNNPEGNN